MSNQDIDVKQHEISRNLNKYRKLLDNSNKELSDEVISAIISALHILAVINFEIIEKLNN